MTWLDSVSLKRECCSSFYILEWVQFSLTNRRVNGYLKPSLFSSQNWFLLAQYATASSQSETHEVAFSAWEVLVSFMCIVRLKLWLLFEMKNYHRLLHNNGLNFVRVFFVTTEELNTQCIAIRVLSCRITDSQSIWNTKCYVTNQRFVAIR
jgi:hypothetical protein